MFTLLMEKQRTSGGSFGLYLRCRVEEYVVATRTSDDVELAAEIPSSAQTTSKFQTLAYLT